MTRVRATRSRLAPLAGLIAASALVSPVAGLFGPDADTPPNKKRSVDQRRQLNLTWNRDEQYETAHENCGISPLGDLARKLGVPATPSAVARAYATHNSPGVRETVRRGCEDAYLERWDPPED